MSSTRSAVLAASIIELSSLGTSSRVTRRDLPVTTVTGPTGAGLQHYELYDLDKDFYQMENIYGQQTDAVKADLHARIAQHFAMDVTVEAYAQQLLSLLR